MASIGNETTSLTFLKIKGTGDTYTDLVSVTTYPALNPPPETIDISDMSSNTRKYAPGMVDLSSFEFGFIYTKTAYDACAAKDGGTENTYQIWFGETGEFGKFQFTGTQHTSIDAGDVGAARTATVTIYVTSPITVVS